MTLEELEDLIGKAEADATTYQLPAKTQPDPVSLQDLPADQLAALQAQAEQQGPQAAGYVNVVNDAPTDPVAGDGLQRSSILPVAKDKDGNIVPALPTAVTEPVNAWKRFVDSVSGQDLSGGVPEVTQQQIGDSLNVAGAVNMPSLVAAPEAGVVNMAKIPLPPSLTPYVPPITIPQVIKQQMKFIKSPQPPTVRLVNDVAANAPKDLKTLETAKDLYKTYIVDEKTALSDIAERAGVPNLKSIKSAIDNDTQLTGMMRVNNSLKTGRLDTTAGSFSVPTPPEEVFMKYNNLPPLAKKDTDQYLKLKDMTDDLNLRIAKNIDVAQSQQMLTDANNSISLIEQRTPIVQEFAQKYRETTEAVRNFLASGPNAMLSQKALAGLGKERANYVPIDIHGINPNDPLWSRMIDAGRVVDKSQMDDWFLHNRDLTVSPTTDNRVDSMETLMAYTRNALQAKMNNDVRGQYADAIANSQFGAETMRPLTKDEIGKYGGRTVQIYKDGKKVPYVASQLQADLLQFDPHIAKWPAMYATKRMFEMGTTGPLGMTFAPVNMMRDMIMGNVTTPSHLGTPGILRTLNEIPRLIAAKTALASSLMLKSSFKDIPFLPPGTKDQLANALGAAYNNSLHALASDQGGVDASLMKSSVQMKKGQINEIKKSLADTAGKVPGANFLGHSARILWDGWDGLFGAISDAPRAAAFRDSIKKGVDPATAAVEARRSSGDTGRGGKVFKPDGGRIDADAVNKPWLLGASPVGWAMQAAREGIPYTNPTIQGLRRIGQAMIDDPVGTNLRAWKYVGIPATAAYGWNEMLGPQYNDYAMKNRNAYDQAMTIYVGMPGLPPEQGIEIPLSQEMQPWASPMTTALYHLGRGDADVSKSLQHVAGTILQNGSMLGYPVGFTQAFNAAGYHAPQSIMTPWSDVYNMREDNVGWFPQNVESVIRSTFGGISDLVLNSTAAGWEGGPEAFVKEFGAQWAKKMPIVKNLTGMKTATSNFTPQSNEKERKVDALNNFLDAWDEHFNDKGGRFSSSKLPHTPDGSTLDPDMSDYKLGPSLTPVPTNPVFSQFGDLIKSYIGTNDEGMTGLKAHYSSMTKQLHLLRGYTAGNASQFREYQKTIVGSQDKYAAALDDLQAKQPSMSSKDYNRSLAQIELNLGEPAKADRMLDEMKIDLSKRGDVNRLINHMEEERGKVIDEQLTLINKLEDTMTQQLHANGMLPPNVRFDVEKHLTPLVPSDFKTPVSQAPTTPVR